VPHTKSNRVKQGVYVPIKRIKSSLDLPVSVLSLLIFIVAIVVLSLFPIFSERLIGDLFAFITSNLSWLYLITNFVILLFVIYLGLSKQGNVRLGKGKPEFSSISWFAMMFSAALGAGLVFFGTGEPMIHYLNPPAFSSVGPSTIDSAIYSMKYSFFHWGFNAWAVYVLVGVALGHCVYNQDKPMLISSAVPLEKIENRKLRNAIRRIIDLFAVFVTVGGISTTMGLMILQMSKGLEFSYGFEISLMVTILIALGLIAGYVLCVSTLVRKGMKFVSLINICLFFFLLAFVFVFGPTLFLLKIGLTSFGEYIMDLVPLSLYADPFNVGGSWLGEWTLFYWAWWFAWAPFCGIFIARISKGRKIKEVVAVGLLITTLIDIIWFTVMGGSTIFFDYSSVVPFGQLIESKGIEVASFVLLEQLPITSITVPILLVLICTFFITSADAATLAVGMFTMKGMEVPPRLIKVVWGIIIGALSVLLVVVGGLKALQTASILTSLPFIIIFFLIMYYIVSKPSY
jgi:choline/carnitine/betaine transport